MKILFNLLHAGYLKHFEGALGLLCDEGHSVHLAFHIDWKFDVAKTTQSLRAAHRHVTISEAPRRHGKWSGFILRIRTMRNYLMYFAPRYAGKDRLRSAAADEMYPSDRAFVEKLVAVPGAGRLLDRVLYLIERAVPADRRIDAFVAQVAPDVLLVSPLVWFNSPQVDYIKSARARGIPSALCVASWDNLTNKGHMRELPDRVTVWNAAQVDEAVEMHRYPRDRVVITGAQTFDEWFEFQPSRSKEAFLAEHGFTPGSPLLLYLCSSRSIAWHEHDFVREWQEAVRNGSDPRVARAAILVRPHPNNPLPWEELDALKLANFAVWPRDSAGQYEAQWQRDYFDSMYHADAVIGLNTSGMIEAGLIGKPVLTLLSKDIPQTLQGTQDTVHFEHLLNVNGGLLHVAESWEEHVQHLARAIDGDPAMADRSRRFTEAFIRPHGIDTPATPILAETIRSLPAVTPRNPWWERVVCGVIIRSLLEIVMIGSTSNRRMVVRTWRRWAAKVRDFIGLYTDRYPRVERVNAAGKSYRFVCYSVKEVRRVGRLFSKEPGTIAWLAQTLRPNDTFFDIGANIGVYSIFAAEKLGSEGSVYAFEPHLASAATLLQNVAVNSLADNTHVISMPLSDRDGFGAFHYHSLESSISSSQFGTPVMDGEEFRPVATELKYGARLDTLIELGVVPVPTIVKIDVDGREDEIVAGMKSLLASAAAPRSVQVELSKDNAAKVIDQMIAAGYELVSRHWTQAGQVAIQKGADPASEFPHNVIFAKVAASAERQPATLALAHAG